VRSGRGAPRLAEPEEDAVTPRTVVLITKETLGTVTEADRAFGLTMMEIAALLLAADEIVTV
jgi:hypothetical protein